VCNLALNTNQCSGTRTPYTKDFAIVNKFFVVFQYVMPHVGCMLHVVYMSHVKRKSHVYIVVSNIRTNPSA